MFRFSCDYWRSCAQVIYGLFTSVIDAIDHTVLYTLRLRKAIYYICRKKSGFYVWSVKNFIFQALLRLRIMLNELLYGIN